MNRRNPYYEYVNYITPLDIKGAYSKKVNFNILPSGYAIFKFNATNTPTGVGFAYSNPQSSTLWEDENTEMKICVVDYAQGKSNHQEDSTAPEGSVNEKYFKLYPNPNDGNALWIETNLERIDEVQLFDARGKLMKVDYSELKSNEKIKTFLINLENFQRGMYLVRLLNGENAVTARVIIK